MDLIFTDYGRNEVGVIKNYKLDFDVAQEKDFSIETTLENECVTPLINWGYFYINGTEIGGRITKIDVDTQNKKIIFTGDNFRGMLNKKIILPKGDYRKVSGKISDIFNDLFHEMSIGDLFIFENCSDEVSNYQFNRYVTLYEGMSSLIDSLGKRLEIRYDEKQNKVVLSIQNVTDYSDEIEYSQDERVNFKITKIIGGTNHLICLGSGELSQRMVIDLYCDNKGNVSDEQYFFGVDEIVSVYEYSNAENYDDLLTNGKTRFDELKNSEAFSVSVEDFELKIGDIIGGRESVTGLYCKSVVKNIIITIENEMIQSQYDVGGL